MSARFRAWRFVHPDLDPWREHAGLQLSPTGAMAMVDEEVSVRQAILLLFSTEMGERVMRPEYGCQLRRLIFSPNDDTTAGLAIHYVRQALDRWEPRIQILRLDADRDRGNSEILNIFLEYRVRATHATGQLVLPLNLTGEPA